VAENEILFLKDLRTAATSLLTLAVGVPICYQESAIVPSQLFDVLEALSSVDAGQLTGMRQKSATHTGGVASLE
jgi:hypothetical protein